MHGATMKFVEDPQPMFLSHCDRLSFTTVPKKKKKKKKEKERKNERKKERKKIIAVCILIFIFLNNLINRMNSFLDY